MKWCAMTSETPSTAVALKSYLQNAGILSGKPVMTHGVPYL